MSSGLFILMVNEESVMASINKGVYGFLMPPIYEDEVPAEVNTMQFYVIMDVVMKELKYFSSQTEKYFMGEKLQQEMVIIQYFI